MLVHEGGATSIVDCSYATALERENFPQTLIEIDGGTAIVAANLSNAPVRIAVPQISGAGFQTVDVLDAASNDGGAGSKRFDAKSFRTVLLWTPSRWPFLADGTRSSTGRETSYPRELEKLKA
jgi:hypothetical protein